VKPYPMTLGKYDELDAAIIAAIRDGRREFCRIYSGEMRVLAGQVNPINPFRAVDGRLQALKRTGCIAFSRSTGWCLTAAEKV